MYFKAVAGTCKDIRLQLVISIYGTFPCMLTYRRRASEILTSITGVILVVIACCWQKSKSKKFDGSAFDGTAKGSADMSSPLIRRGGFRPLLYDEEYNPSAITTKRVASSPRQGGRWTILFLFGPSSSELILSAPIWSRICTYATVSVLKLNPFFLRVKSYRLDFQYDGGGLNLRTTDSLLGLLPVLSLICNGFFCLGNLLRLVLQVPFMSLTVLSQPLEVFRKDTSDGEF